jgi:hypothetical protein
MLRRQLFLISLFVLFVGGFTQGLQGNDQNWNADRSDKLKYRQRRQVQDVQSKTQNSANSLNQRSFRGPTLNQMALTNSVECTADISKYCIKGGTKQYMTNLKVLQCIDDLDNVSLFTILKTSKLY